MYFKQIEVSLKVLTSLVAYSIKLKMVLQRDYFCFFSQIDFRTMIIGICLLMSKEAITTNVLFFFFFEEKEPV